MTLDPLSLDFSDSIAREAFGALLENAEPISAPGLAKRLGADEGRVRDVFSKLRAAGRAELDDDGQLMGVYGLTLKPTEHKVELRDSTFFVWCAFDAVGIPAALGESAIVDSECAQCGSAIHLDIDKGAEPLMPLVISWRPQKCDSVREEFCPTVNFYCNTDHYKSSVEGGRDPEALLTLAAAAELGRENWGWASKGGTAS